MSEWRTDTFKDVYIPIFGENIDIPEDDDLFEIAKKCNENPNKPRVYMGVGTEDFMYSDNVRLKERFESLDFDYTYRESKGTHSWEFWDEYIQYVLKWLLG